MNLEEALQDLEENLDELAEARTVRERQREALEAARAKSILLNQGAAVAAPPCWMR